MLGSLDEESRTSTGWVKVQPWQRDYARWLLQYIDPMDWGYTPSSAPRTVARTPPDKHFDAALQGKYHPQRLSQRLIADHTTGRQRLHYVSRRDSGFAFVRFDVDAHRGQTDATEAARYIHDDLFPGAYYEPTPRGWALYILANVGYRDRRDANDIIGQCRNRLAQALRRRGLHATIEVQGKFTIIDWDARTIAHRAPVGAMPRLPRGEADWLRLRDVAVVPLESLLGDEKRSDGPKPVPSRKTRQIDESNAFDRMRDAGYEMRRVLRRVPDVSELVEFYAIERYPGLATVDADTYRRAAEVVKYLNAHDNPLAYEAGYLSWREKMIDAVRTHCTDRRNDYGICLSDEVLAVHLYTVQRNTFAIADRPMWQFTCPNDAVIGMFRRLADEKVIDPTPISRKILAASKAVLERGNLIECVEESYRPGGKIHGIGKKYTVGTNHFRHAEFQRFSRAMKVETIPVKPVESGTAVPIIRSTTGTHTMHKIAE